MKITRDMLKNKKACDYGYLEFCKAFPEAEYPDGVEYQYVLDKCAENDRNDFAEWLLFKFGRTDDVKKIDGDYISDKSIFVCGSLEVTGKIICKGRVQAGWGIEAGEGIKAGCGIEAGWGIKAGEGIEAGIDFGIYAGLSCLLSLHNFRKISAKEKPENIMCGEWVEK